MNLSMADRTFNVKHMIAELRTLEVESSLPEDCVNTLITARNSHLTDEPSSVAFGADHPMFASNIADADLLQRELSQFDDEFLEDFSAITAEDSHLASVHTETFTLPANPDDGLLAKLPGKPGFDNDDLTHAVRARHGPASSFFVAHAEEDAAAKPVDGDPQKDESRLINRLIDAQLCQRINTSIRNVNRIQSDFGIITAVASCPECVVVGSSGGYLLVFDNAGKVIARFDRSNALGAVSALDVNPRGSRALCGYSRGHVALIDLQKCYRREGPVAGGSGEFLKTVSVASPQPSPILQVRFCSSLSGNPNDDNNITCVCLESGGSVFRLRFRRLLNIITCDADCIFSGARGEAVLIEPFVSTAPSLMPEYHPLRAAQLLAIGTLNKVLLISLTDNTCDVFLHIPLPTLDEDNTPDGSVMGSDHGAVESSRRSSSMNTLTSSGSFNNAAPIESDYRKVSHFRTLIPKNRLLRLPCASWAFASVQPPTTTASSATSAVCRDPVLAITDGLHVMLYHISSDARRMPVGRLIKNVMLGQQQGSVPTLTSIVNVKWLSTVTLLLFDVSGLVALYDLKTGQLVDYIAPEPNSCDTNSDADTASGSTVSHTAHNAGRSRSSTMSGQPDDSFRHVLSETHDKERSVLRPLFTNRSAYSGGEAGSLVSEAMADVGDYATYASVCCTITVRPAQLLSAADGSRKTSRNSQRASVDFAEQQASNTAENVTDLAGNVNPQRIFCLLNNSDLCCVRLRTAKERLEEFERQSRFADALEFALSLYAKKRAGEGAELNSMPNKKLSAAAITVSEIISPEARSNLQRLLLNMASQLVAKNSIFYDLVQQAFRNHLTSVAFKKLLLQRNAVAYELHRSVQLCFLAIFVLKDSVLLADLYGLFSFQAQASDDVNVLLSLAAVKLKLSESDSYSDHVLKKILCQSVSPENEFFIRLPSVLQQDSESRSNATVFPLWYEAQMPGFVRRMVKIVGEACDVSAVVDANHTVPTAESADVDGSEPIDIKLVDNTLGQTRRRLLQTFTQMTLEADLKWFDIDETLTVAARLLQTHTIMRISMDLKKDFVTPLTEFVSAMRSCCAEEAAPDFDTSTPTIERKSMLNIHSLGAYQLVGNNVVLYLCENLKGRRCFPAAGGQRKKLDVYNDDTLIADAHLRRQVQEGSWQWLTKQQTQNSAGSISTTSDAESVSNLTFLLHFNAKDLLNALQMCYADQCFCDAINVEQRNRLVSLLIKVMLIDNNNSGNYYADTHNDAKLCQNGRAYSNANRAIFTPAQIAHLFTFIARLIAASSTTSATTKEGSLGIVDVNRALLEQILHHLCQHNFTTSAVNSGSSNSSDECELALIELFEAGALQCMNETLIVEKAKKAQFLTFIKLIYSRNKRFEELFLALLDCFVAKKRESKFPVDNIADEVGELFAAARQVLVSSDLTTTTAGNHAASHAEAERRVAVALLEHIVLLTQLDAEQTSFLVLQYFIKQRISVEIISNSAATRNGRGAATHSGKKFVLLPHGLLSQSSRQRLLSEDEVFLSVLRAFDADDQSDVAVQRAKFEFIMCFWKRGLLPLNFSAAALEMSAAGGGNLWMATRSDDSNAQQASARVCWLLIDWTCQELETAKRHEQDNDSDDDDVDAAVERQNREEIDLANILLDILRAFYFSSPSSATATTNLALSLPNEEARNICRKHSIALAEAYLFELDGNFVEAYRILFHEQFCAAVEVFCATAVAQNADKEDAEQHAEEKLTAQFNVLINIFEVLLEFCQRVNNRVASSEYHSVNAAAASMLEINDDVSEESAPLNELFTRQKMWLNIFKQFMTLMKHVEILNGLNVITGRAGDALQRLLAAMIAYHVDMLHVLKQLVMSPSSAASTVLAGQQRNRFAPCLATKPTTAAAVEHPRLRLILDNIIASYEYQCTLYESVTTLLQNGVYNSLAHYLRSMRKHCICVAAFRTAVVGSNSQSAVHYYYNADGGFFYNQLWRNAAAASTGSGVCCVCNKPIAFAVEFGFNLRNSRSPRLCYGSKPQPDEDVAVLHNGIVRRVVHLQCILSRQQRRFLRESKADSDDESDKTASAPAAVTEVKFPVSDADVSVNNGENSYDVINDVCWSFE